MILNSERMEKLQKQLLREFMLSSPSRPFEEVIEYARELGLSEETIKDAILSLNDPEEVSIEENVDLSQIHDKVGFAKTEANIVKKNDKKKNYQYLFITFAKYYNVSKDIFGSARQILKSTKKHANRKKELIPLEEAYRMKLMERKFWHFKIRPSKILNQKFIISIASLAFCLVLFLNFSHFISNIIDFKKNTLGEQTASEVVIANPSTESKVKTVYVNQMSIDPKKIFSAPSTDITLDYSGKINKEVFGFFPYWMLDVHDSVNFDVVTTVALFGISVDGNGDVITDDESTQEAGWTMWFDKRLDELIEKLKRKNIRIVLTMKSFDSENIENLILKDSSQRAFIANTIHLINTRSLDGVNIDFEHTGSASSELRFAFTRFIANLNSELDRQVPKAHLSVDTYLKSALEDDLYDISLLADYVDSIFIMGYDVHSPNTEPGPVAPLEGEHSVTSYMKSYLDKVDAKKLILGVPYYGYDWPITESSDSASLKAEGNVNMLSYAEISSSNTVSDIVWNEDTKTPYYRYIDQNNSPREVHFDTPRSLGAKFDYINKNNLQGVGIWALGYDGSNQDFTHLIFDKFSR